MTHEPEVEAVYEEFWKELVETDGVLDAAKVKAELYDYHTLLMEVPKAYCHITRGRISKPHTAARYVIAEFEEYVQTLVDEAVEEAIAASDDAAGATQ